MSIGLKRAYEAPAKSDGCLILVDRIWPRGITKDGRCCMDMPSL